MNKSNVGRNGILSYTSISQFITEGIQSKNSNPELENGTETGSSDGIVLTSFCPIAFWASFYIEPRVTRPKVAQPKQATVSKINHYLKCFPIWLYTKQSGGCFFSQMRFSLPKLFYIFQIHQRLSSTIDSMSSWHTNTVPSYLFMKFYIFLYLNFKHNPIFKIPIVLKLSTLYNLKLFSISKISLKVNFLWTTQSHSKLS